MRFLKAVWRMVDAVGNVAWLSGLGGGFVLTTSAGGLGLALGLPLILVFVGSIGVGLLTCAAIIVLIRRATPGKRPAPPASVVEVVGQNFENQTVPIDFRVYRNCTFKSCTFKWDGGPGAIVDCQTEGSRRFETQNEVSLHTVDVLRFLGFLDLEFANSWTRKPADYFASKQG